MRQVPSYLFIGGGHVSRHFQHYFTLLHIPYTTWNRKNSTVRLDKALSSATHILVLIKDEEIDKFIAQHSHQTDAIFIHFSGSLVSEQAYGAHPLMTFSQPLYDLTQYQTIPFVIDHDAPSFGNLLPGLLNSHVRLNKSLKAKYHALCVLSGNFSCLLWQKFFSSLQNEFNIPEAFAHPYLLQQMHNLIHYPKNAFTGPLARNDQETIKKNLTALAKDPFQEVYKSFLSCYNQAEEKKGG